MATKSNVPAELKAAIKAANTVDTSHRGHHLALCALVSYMAKLEITDAIAVLNLYVDDRRAKSPNSLCTNSTFRWFTDHFGFQITSDGLVKRGKHFDQKGLTPKAFDAAKAKPWYNIANDLAFKVPVGLNMQSVAVIQARLEATGAPTPTDEEILAEFKGKLAAARKSEAVKAWKHQYDEKVASGEITPAKYDVPKVIGADAPAPEAAAAEAAAAA